MKKTYHIQYYITNIAWADIEAESLDKAEEIAEEMGGEDFIKGDDDLWELDHSYNVEVNEYNEDEE